jgi:two-component system response regulator HydG
MVSYANTLVMAKPKPVPSACMMTQGDVVDVSDLPERVRQTAGEEFSDNGLLPLEELDRRHTRRVLESVRGNKTRAAEILGISRATLYRLIDASATREPEEVAESAR